MKTLTEGVRRMPLRLAFLVLAALILTTSAALAHDVTPGDACYIQEIWGCISSPSSISAQST